MSNPPEQDRSNGLRRIAAVTEQESDATPAGAHKLDAEPGEVRIAGFAPSIIIAGRDQATGHSRIRVQDPETASVSTRSPDGRITTEVTGVANVGRAGEPRLTRTFRQALSRAGIEIITSPGRDDWGEDGVFTAGTRQLVLQVVTSPADADFWSETRSGASKEGSAEEAVKWLHEVITKKAERTPPAERSRTVIAVDIRHAGVLAEQPSLDTYLKTYDEPTAAFGLASVWVIGPTTEMTSRLGVGFP